ncbi:TPA: hypothetical protein I7172_04105 [Vibrio vulnificus]|nr:hypothetical protein [Vibrio vulnificus]
MIVRFPNVIMALILISSFFSVGLPSDDVQYLALFFSLFIILSSKVNNKSFFLGAFLLFLFIINSLVNMDKGVNIAAILQFFVSIFFGSSIYNYITKKSTFLFNSKVIGGLLLVIIVLVILEMSEITTSLVNSYRINFLGVTPEVIANDYSRDLSMNGYFVRPTLFMKEASYAYCFIFFLSSIYLVLNKTVVALFSLYLLSVFLFFVYRTPSVFLSVTFYSFLFALDFSSYFERFSRKSKLTLFIIIFSFLLILLFFAQEKFLVRVSSVDFSDRDALNSVTIRVVAPIYFVFDTYRNYPLFGIGISNLDFAFNKFGVIGNNGFANLLCFLGLFGIAFLALIYYSWGRVHAISKKNLFCGVIFLILILNQLGGTTTFSVWLYFFSFLAVLSKANTNIPQFK